jgi:hypothetical protein
VIALAAVPDKNPALRRSRQLKKPGIIWAGLTVNLVGRKLKSSFSPRSGLTRRGELLFFMNCTGEVE